MATSVVKRSAEGELGDPSHGEGMAAERRLG
jgi:hypothetical protein